MRIFPMGSRTEPDGVLIFYEVNDALLGVLENRPDYFMDEELLQACYKQKGRHAFLCLAINNGDIEEVRRVHALLLKEYDSINWWGVAIRNFIRAGGYMPMHSITGQAKPMMRYATGLLYAAYLGYNAYSMYANQKNTTAQTKAIKEQANINAQTSANNTRRIAAAQRAGFLNSGIALTGDGTAQSLFDETYDLGRTDISRIYSNANTEISQPKK